MQTILITGGTGMVGSRLTEMLVDKGYAVIVLSRAAKQSSNERVRYAVWDIDKQTIAADAVAKADVIVHLAGANVGDKRWTKVRKQEIVDSRTKSSALLVQALQTMPNKVTTVVSASGIGWYGPDTASSRVNGFTEELAADGAYLGETCRVWETSIEPVVALGKRLVKLRTGIALSKGGGVIEEFKKPLKYGLATILGSGEQIISWIHLDDLCRVYIKAIEDSAMHGVYNAVAPQPVTNKAFTLLLATKMRGKAYIPVYVPSFALKIGIGELSVEVLKSANVSADKLKQTGFTFLYPSIASALDDVV